MKNSKIILILLLTSLVFSSYKSNKEVLNTVPKPFIFIPQVNYWDVLIEALIYVESRGDNYIVGNCNDVGCLQITPIYVKEVNRLSNEDYQLVDRTSRKYSIEMFNIVQNHYNPNKDIIKAISLHNPGGGKSYIQKVLTKYKEIYDKNNFITINNSIHCIYN
jgi:hypothetical protein